MLDLLEQRDKMIFDLSDTLDVKVSICLVLLTFLSTQTAYFLGVKPASPFVMYPQILSAVLLVLAFTAALVALWPRTHDTEKAETFGDWYHQLEKHFADEDQAEVKARKHFDAERENRLKQQIGHNRKIVNNKSRWAEWAYHFTALSIALNALCLLFFAFRTLS